MPNISETQIELLEKLCNASAVSGDEGEVRKIILEEVKPYADTVKVDALGNVLVTKNGTGADRVRVMLDCHMDEVGFMLVSDDGEGLYRFELVGGIDVRQLPGKQVLVGKEKIPGVIGARPIHLTTSEERQKKIPLDALRIDIGPGGKARPGDRAVFATRFQRVGSSILAKAIDNRIGCALLIDLLKTSPANIDLCLSFSVQEEIGLRGAKVAAFHFNPDMAIAIDATPANDLPVYDGSENTFYNTRLGQGPAIYTFDSGTLNDPRLIHFLAHTAEAAGIPYQFRQPGGGGTDAGAIHRTRTGVPTVSVSVPHRYTHSAISLARIEDWQNTLALLTAALERITPDLLQQARP
ncbi:MAG: M42 family metallopeptidase [Anaerolineales bacterium]|nr:M42 family metallopeptidase [Anaerolineales bacterium]MDW8276941.1 M42 family metallopeptidase [Anaerolineales bacterium]